MTRQSTNSKSVQNPATPTAPNWDDFVGTPAVNALEQTADIPRIKAPLAQDKFVEERNASAEDVAEDTVEDTSDRPSSPEAPGTDDSEASDSVEIPEASTTSEQQTYLQAKHKFRLPGLDGIRALACFAVLGYHLLPPGWMPGGFLGVDVFFVLSGFLITSLLLKEKRRSGGIDIAAFWIRRIRRLLPAVMLAGLVTAAIAVLVSRDFLVGLGRQLDGLATFTYNWLEISRGASYFDQANPQLYTNVWSLAVEQQFYVVWPLLVLIFTLIPEGRIRRTLGVLATLFLAAASATWMWWLVQDPARLTRAYMGSDSHAFGLMIGAGLAFAMPRILQGSEKLAGAVTRAVRTFLAWIAFVLMIVGFFVVTDTNPWSYPFLTLVECLFVVLIIQSFAAPVIEAGGFSRSLVALLELRPLVWLGERSYGIYLWHWPLWVIMGKLAPFMALIWQATIVALASIIAAAVSFRLLETPMRINGIFPTIRSWRHWIISRSRLLLGAIVVLLSIMLVGMFWMLATAPKQTSAEEVVNSGSTNSSNPPAPTGENKTDANKSTPADSDKASDAQAGKSESGDSKAGESQSGNSTSSQKPKDKNLPSGQPVGKNVTVIGDSVTLACKNSLEEAFPGAVVDGKVSRALPSVFTLLEDYRNSGKLGEYVVVGLATNSAIAPDQLQKLLDDLNPKQRLVLVTAFGSARTTWIEPSNEVIRAFAAEHPDRVQVANWDKLIADHTDNLAGDQVHPDGVGAGYYTEAVKEALASFPNVREVGAPGNRVFGKVPSLAEYHPGPLDYWIR